MLNVKT
jgi:hypothetical protein